jgi:predicted nucleic acid-binding protein
LVANKALLAEYEKYAEQFEAEYIFFYLKSRIVLINISDEEIQICRQFFPDSQLSDAVHAATCLQSKAVLITNDKQMPWHQFPYFAASSTIPISSPVSP